MKWNSVKQSAVVSPLVILAAVLLLVISSQTLAFKVEDAVARLVDDAFEVDVNIAYEFTEVALQALENGVPLTVDIHFQIRRDGAWIWEKDIVDSHLRRQLRYLPLSSTYEVTDIDRKEIKLYFSRLAAIKAMGTVNDYQVVREQQLEKNEAYTMEIRSRLDIEALPVPLRPTAYMSSDWKMSSEWSQWHIRP